MLMLLHAVLNLRANAMPWCLMLCGVELEYLVGCPLAVNRWLVLQAWIAARLANFAASRCQSLNCDIRKGRMSSRRRRRRRPVPDSATGLTG
jgi:hypothetical protein